MKNGSCSATTVAGSAALPFVISTGEVMGLRTTQGDENGSCSATTLAGSAPLPFVISTGEVMGRWPAEGDEKRFSSNYCRWKRRPPLCHLDRSAAQWRDLRRQRSLPWKTLRDVLRKLQL